MARILERLEDHAEDLRHRPPHPLLGSPSLSVGVIEGGQAVNIVPDRCWIEIDRRTLPGETRECVLEPIRRILSEVQGWTMEPPHLAVAGMEVPEDSPVVRLLASAIRQELGRVEIESARYATDAGVYNAAGIPTIVFGPGDIALAHTAVESIDLQELEKAAIIIRRFLSL
jgi:acetylornithine deacetylase/succinyl-diaminopimelate desuccinylase-like protein